MSLVLEPELGLHVLLGLAFVGLVVVHLGQRRRTSSALVRRLRRPVGRSGRLALADVLLAALTVAMLGSGLWDWLDQPTKIRWHAITGVLLAGLLAVHTTRRSRRLRKSDVR